MGGGYIAFILDNNFANTDPDFNLAAGTEMIFWYATIHWVDIGEDNLILYSALQPIGEFRKICRADWDQMHWLIGNHTYRHRSKPEDMTSTMMVMWM